ncbi:MAG: T9SS type A sorting domain-containing protein [bacterium]|nr:T9SS type A sorting domain-containing protein [bacterium]
MNKFKIFSTIVFLSILAMNVIAEELPDRAIGNDRVFYGGNPETAKASRDTIFLIGPPGSGAQANGQFESASGVADWQGWTHYDITQPTDTHFHISDYNGPNGPGNMAMYCGDETIPACDANDPIGGYGNQWEEILRFSYVVADPNSPCTMTVSGVLNHDTEIGYDYVRFFFHTSDGIVTAGALDGTRTNVPFSFNLTYSVADYIGNNDDEVRFDVNFLSDAGWSDEDCSFYGVGACTLDDIRTVCSNGGYDHTEDFSDGMGEWTLGYPRGTGDFAQLWQGLEGVDPCFTNYTPQVAFIDDGTQVEGAGPSYCQDWCYGPGGYIVNSTGGAAISTNVNAYLHVAVESPIVEWPGSDYLGSLLTYGVYRHEELAPDSPGMFYTWGVRSGTSEADILTADWKDRNQVLMGGPDYFRSGEIVSDLLVPARTHVQVQLACFELGWNWGFYGDNGTPAPYFDNVRLTAFAAEGPAMATLEIDLANDNWPEIAQVDMNNLGANSVRFDGSKNKGDDTMNVPGDSVVCDVVSVRVGGALVENRLYYSMDRNPVFDSVRDPAWGATGFVDARPAVNNAGNIVPDKFAYDLPDTGFLFPGDVLHYYFSATDEVGHSDPETSTVPANLNGFGDFSFPLGYSRSFQVHALPSVDSEGDHPEILFWNDFANRGGENEWYGAFNNIGMIEGEHYDVYYTNGPDSGVGNGLGGRASNLLMDGYKTLLYTSGDLSVNTIANGDPMFDPSDDVGLLADWVDQNEVNLFLTGDDLASDLANSGNATSTFLDNYLNVTVISDDLRPLITNQATPLVLPEPGAPVFQPDMSWVAYGGCRGINSFDAVEVRPGAQQLARFTDEYGSPDYSYSAATLNETGTGDKIISVPYDFSYIYTDIDNPVSGGVATRTRMLEQVLTYFGFDTSLLVPSNVPVAEKFAISNYPNPFNPTTKIQFNMPKDGHLSLKVYNVRGELVRTLIDEARLAGSDHIMWDGKSDQGSSVSSGVYFYEARTGKEVSVNKMALVK